MKPFDRRSCLWFLGLVLMIDLGLWSRPVIAEPIIVLDPGHGGSNRGAVVEDFGAMEKQLTLAITKRLESYLHQWLPQATVILTRHQDEYLTLQNRVKLANQAHASLMVSIHVNASEGHAEHGFETYFLTQDASFSEAARERLTPSGPEPPVKNERLGTTGSKSSIWVNRVLSDLKQEADHASSAELATALQRSLALVRGHINDRGVRQAAFDVLLGARMPAVLVEVGFLDHLIEGPELLQPGVQELIAIALAEGIIHYFRRASPSN